jgi:hypothetical protein
MQILPSRVSTLKLFKSKRAQARIGVRAAGKQTNEQKGRGSVPDQTLTPVLYRMN